MSKSYLHPFKLSYYLINWKTSLPKEEISQEMINISKLGIAGLFPNW